MVSRISNRFAPHFHQYKLLYLILVVALLLRAALTAYVAPYPERYIQSDAVGYQQLALNLMAGNGFSMSPAAPYSPDNFRTPGYPLTIAAVYTFVGNRPDLVLWLQVLFSTLTLPIVYFAARLFASNSAALIAAALLAISPISIIYTSLLWSDTEFTFFLALAIAAALLMVSRCRWQWAVIGGLLMGLATLVHPRALYLPLLVISLVLAAWFYQKLALKRMFLLVGLYLLAFYLTLVPWYVRNQVVFGVPTFTSAAGVNMLHYGAALTESAQTGEDQWAIVSRYDAELRALNSHPLNAADYGEKALQLGVQKILKQPLLYARIHLVGMVKIFLPNTFTVNTLLAGESTDTSQIYGALSAAGLGGGLVQRLSEFSPLVWLVIGIESIYLLVVYGLSLYTLSQYRRNGWVWFLLIVVFYLALVAGPAGAPRFRVAMMPLLSLLAADGLARRLKPQATL